MSEPAHVLVVAHQTAATSGLLDAVRERAGRGPATFHLVVPQQAHGMHKVVDPQDAGVDRRVALPKLSEAAGREVTGSIGDAEPLMAIQDAVNLGEYDEIIISTLPLGISRWLKLDLVSKARGLGLPVTHVAAPSKVEAAATEEAAATAPGTVDYIIIAIYFAVVLFGFMGRSTVTSEPARITAAHRIGARDPRPIGQPVASCTPTGSGSRRWCFGIVMSLDGAKVRSVPIPGLRFSEPAHQRGPSMPPAHVTVADHPPAGVAVGSILSRAIVRHLAVAGSSRRLHEPRSSPWASARRVVRAARRRSSPRYPACAWHLDPDSQ